MASKSRPCAICGVMLSEERLCDPMTRLCLEHSRMIEKYGGEFLTTVRRSSLGKANSLKKNYGDVTATRVRNLAALERLREEWAAKELR